MHHLLMSNSQASDCYKKLLACAAECEFVASRETKMWYLWFHKAHKVDWKAKYPVFDTQFRYKIVHDAPIIDE